MSISVGMGGADVPVGQAGIVDGRIIYRNLTICLKALLAMGLIAVDVQKGSHLREGGGNVQKRPPSHRDIAPK
ncbi:hypothetical protein, partial [Pseudomonas sp. MWU12-2115]|uniref:hypothetical protein n=1 Tax=Pseudomonas sp. MWU12-2115 TaxID=2071713 RepID=UPI001C499E28